MERSSAICSLAKKICLLFCVTFLVLSADSFAQSSLEILGAEGERSSALPNGRGGTLRSPGLNPGLSLSNNNKAAEYGVFAPDEEAQAEKTPEEIEAMIREQALSAALTGLLPMNANEIRKLLERFDDTQQAVEVPIYPYPEPEIVARTVSLDPGTKPPVLKVAVGHVTSLNLLDITGAPWPIQDLTFAGNFEVVPPEPGGHVVRITGMSEFGYGNVSIRLLELNTPVTFTLKTSRDSVYYRFDAKIAEYGPYAEAPLIDGGLSIVAGDNILGSILDGLPPSGSEKLDVAGVDGRTTAYLYGKKTYVRTPLTLLSPGWSGSVSSADGMSVYVVAKAPVLLLSDHGRVVRARLSEEEPLDE